jgi:hypothetical protein
MVTLRRVIAIGLAANVRMALPFCAFGVVAMGWLIVARNIDEASQRRSQ